MMTNNIYKHNEFKERNQTIDFMKGVGVILMIQVHIIKLFAKPEIFDSLFGKISLFLGGPFVAPVFMFAMGYFLAQSKRSTVSNIRRGLFLASGGLMLNIALNFNLLLSIYVNNSLLNPCNYIFGVDILVLAGLSTIILALIKFYFKKSAVSYCALACAVLITGSFVSKPDNLQNEVVQHINAFFWGDYEWSYFPLIPWLAYPLFGYAYYEFEDKNLFQLELSIVSKLILLFLLIIACSLNFQYAFKTAIDLKRYYHHGYLFGLWLVLFLSFWYLSVSFLEKYFGRSIIFLYIKWLGRKVTALYVFQWLLIGNIGTIIYKTQNNAELSIWFMLIIISVSLLNISFRPPWSYINRNKYNLNP